MDHDKNNHHDLASVIMAICAIIVVVIELARFILDYIVK